MEPKSHMSQGVIRKVRFVSVVTPQMALRIEHNTTVHTSEPDYVIRTREELMNANAEMGYFRANIGH
jgi:hypothetical protein